MIDGEHPKKISLINTALQLTYSLYNIIRFIIQYENNNGFWFESFYFHLCKHVFSTRARVVIRVLSNYCGALRHKIHLKPSVHCSILTSDSLTLIDKRYHFFLNLTKSCFVLGVSFVPPTLCQITHQFYKYIQLHTVTTS